MKWIRLRRYVKGYLVGDAIGTDYMAVADEPEEEPYDWFIECDASWKHGVAGFGYRAWARGGRRRRGRSIARKARGSQHAEALCILAGLRDVLQKAGGDSMVLIKCDSKWLVEVLNGHINPSKPYLVEALAEIRKADQSFYQVEYRWVPSRHLRTSDKAATRGRKRAEAREAERVARRAEKVEAAFRRAQGFEVSRMSNGSYLVRRKNSVGAFTVDLENLQCSCSYFQYRWAAKSMAARARNMTPCAHMAAASIHRGVRDMPWDRYRA